MLLLEGSTDLEDDGVGRGADWSACVSGIEEPCGWAGMLNTGEGGWMWAGPILADLADGATGFCF